MKAEERHEMEMNVLAKWLFETGNKVKPYTTHIVYGLFAVVAAWAVWSLSSGAVGSKDQAGWDVYARATLPGNFDSEELKTAAEAYADKPVGTLAHIMWADGQLQTACHQFLLNKVEATKRLEQAEKAYTDLASQEGDQVIRGRAELGLARVLEIRGEIDEAIAAYNEVEGIYAQFASARAKQLEELGAKDYANWLASAEGSRTAPGLGAGGLLDFSAFDLSLPADGSADGGLEGADEILERIRRFQNAAPEEGTDRYGEIDLNAGSAEEGSEEGAVSTDDETTGETEEPMTEEPMTGEATPEDAPEESGESTVEAAETEAVEGAETEAVEGADEAPAAP